MALVKNKIKNPENNVLVKIWRNWNPVHAAGGVKWCKRHGKLQKSSDKTWKYHCMIFWLHIQKNWAESQTYFYKNITALYTTAKLQEVAQGFTDSWMENVQYILNETLSVKEKPDTSNNVSGLLRMWPWDCKWLNWNRSHWGNHTEWARAPPSGGQAPTFCLLSQSMNLPWVLLHLGPKQLLLGRQAGYVSHFDLLVLQTWGSDKALLENSQATYQCELSWVQAGW